MTTSYFAPPGCTTKCCRFCKQHQPKAGMFHRRAWGWFCSREEFEHHLGTHGVLQGVLGDAAGVDALG